MTSNTDVCGNETPSFERLSDRGGKMENFFLKFLEPGLMRGVKGLCV
jgi:hypothetical protein